MRADRMGCYGNPRQTSPAIDQFVKKSTLCLNHYTIGHNSMQSHTSLFTGVHPQFHGCPDNWSYYDYARKKLPTLTQLLRKDGYYIYGISSDANLFWPARGMNHGYHRYVYLRKSKAVRSESSLIGKLTKMRYGKARGMYEVILHVSKKLDYKFERYAHNSYQRDSERFYLKNDDTGQLLVNTLTRDMERFPKDRPFFAFANILETHSPYLAPRHFRETFGKVAISDRLRRALFSYGDRLWTPEPLSDEEKEALGILYDCEVRYVDHLVEQLLKALERQGRLEDTVVIFTSDHGGILGEQEGQVGPIRNTYQGIMKTPLIVYSPGHPGRRETRLTSIVDVFSTVLAETGTPNDRKFNYQCKNVLSVDWDREFVVCEVPALPAPKDGPYTRKQVDALIAAQNVNRTMIFQDAKFIWRSNGKHLYFDLKQDPKEISNLFPEKMSARQYQELMRKLLAWYESQWDSDTPFCLERLESTFWNPLRDQAGPPGVTLEPDQTPVEEETIADKLNAIVAKPF